MRSPYHTASRPISQRARLAILLAAVGLLAAASAAVAATSSDTSQIAVTPGSLTFSTGPDVPNLPGLTLNGQAQTLNAQMNNFTVSDATGAATGWKVTVSGDNTGGKSPVFKQYCPTATCGSDSGPGYVTGGATFAANSLTLNSTGAGFSAQNGTTGTAPTHQCNSSCFVDAVPASPVKIVSAASSAGMGTYATTGYSATSVALAAPSTVQALQTNEVYHIDLLWTLASGP
jgi:putative surface cell wall-binding protein